MGAELFKRTDIEKDERKWRDESFPVALRKRVYLRQKTTLIQTPGVLQPVSKG
jgi:hypothetical protein